MDKDYKIIKSKRGTYYYYHKNKRVSEKDVPATIKQGLKPTKKIETGLPAEIFLFIFKEAEEGQYDKDGAYSTDYKAFSTSAAALKYAKKYIKDADTGDSPSKLIERLKEHGYVWFDCDARKIEIERLIVKN